MPAASYFENTVQTDRIMAEEQEYQILSFISNKDTYTTLSEIDGSCLRFQVTSFKLSETQKVAVVLGTVQGGAQPSYAYLPSCGKIGLTALHHPVQLRRQSEKTKFMFLSSTFYLFLFIYILLLHFF